MGKHRLSLEIPDTLNSCILKIADSSTYDDLLPVKCPRLQVSIPGFSSSYFVEDISQGFSLNLTACQLGIQTEQCGVDFNDLPSGIYVLNYSVSPHDTVYVEYNFLRTTKELLRLKKLYCDLDLENCLSTPEKKKKLDNARLIHDYLRSAKAKVELCREASQGLNLFKEAIRLLDKACCKNC